ncbi:hypothetical protein YC2023_053148 [Brassica napus]
MERERVGGPKGERVADFSLRIFIQELRRSTIASQITSQLRRTAIQLAIEPEVRDRPEAIRSPKNSQTRRLQPVIDSIRNPIGGRKRPIISTRSLIHSQVVRFKIPYETKSMASPRSPGFTSSPPPLVSLFVFLFYGFTSSYF